MIFGKTNIKLPDESIPLVEFLGGSHLYGTNTPESDEDFRGVFIAPKQYYLGCQKKIESVERTGEKEEDCVYYELKKFFQLAAEGNPTIIEFLFVPKNKELFSSKIWNEIRKNSQIFLSKKVKFSFSGYAFSQLKRIDTHRGWLLNPPKEAPQRKTFGLPEEQKLARDQIGAFNVILAQYMDEILSIHPLKQQLLDMLNTTPMLGVNQSLKNVPWDAVQEITGIDSNFIEILKRERAYEQEKKRWNSYLTWKENRNAKRAELEKLRGFDLKHASHLYRLLTEGKELLTDGVLTLPRPDANLLLGIKNGCWSYEELMNQVQSFEVDFDNLYKTSNLPHSPNHEAIDELLIKIVSKSFRKTK